MTKNPYTPALAYQLLEIPIQLIQHLALERYPEAPQTHRFGDNKRQYLLFWPKANPQTPRKSVVIFYHGGAWITGAPALLPTLATFFLQAGFPVIKPAYRLSPRFAYPDMRADLNSAMVEILPLLDQHGLGDHQLLLGGMSAGANLAAHLTFDVEALAALGLSQDRISGFLSIGGPLDLTKMPHFKPVHWFAGGKHGSDSFQLANPIRHLSGQEKIPALFMHGTADRIVPIESAAAFAAQYAGPSTWIEMPKQTHIGSVGFLADHSQYAEDLLQWLSDK